MATARRPFPYWNNLRDYVQAELNRRKLRPAKFGIGPQDDSKFTPLISPFVRFTSTIADLDYGYKFFSLGLHGYDDVRSGPFVFDLTYGGTDVVGFAYGTDSPQSNKTRSTRNTRKPITADMSKATEGRIGGAALGRHPTPGVTAIRFNYLGPNNFIEIDVTWKCYNNIQLEFLRPHFIMAGAYVVVEVGHEYSDLGPTPTFDFGRSDALDELTKCVVNGRSYINDVYVAHANGNYDMYIGQIISSEINQLRDSTFEVVTKIASKGEAMFGLDNHRLQGNSQDLRVRTIQDYFDPTNVVGYDALLSANMGTDAKISEVVDASKSHKQFQQNVDKAQSDLKAGKEIDPQLQIEGTVFVSWNFFLKKILPDLFSHFVGQGISKEMRMFTHINETIDNKPEDEPWVGNHTQLLSVDLDTVLIVKPFARKQDNTGLFSNAEDFEDAGTANTFRAKLSKGVWLNAEVIRTAFLTHPKFIDSMKEILRRMNQASADYWNLDIIWDEDKNRIVIYDAPHITDTLNKPAPGEIYTFNSGTVGELLGFNFNSQFSKEVMAAIMLHRSDPSGSANVHGNLQGPDIHAFVINAPGDNTTSAKFALLLNDSIEKTLVGTDGEPNTNTTMEQHADRYGITPKLLEDTKQMTDRAARQQQELEEQRAQVAAKFEKSLTSFVTIPSIVKGQTSNIGLEGTVPNNYIAPVPTEINMDITFQGIGGIAFFDAFAVDKLPEIYNRSGLFLINKLTHEVSVETGWRTSISGQFYFIFHEKFAAPAEITPAAGPLHASNTVDPRVTAWLGSAEDALGVPVSATSLTRTPEHNAAIGGSKTSSHLVGQAADFTVQGLSNQQVKERLLAAQAAGKLPPFDQLIFESDHVHIGLGPKQRGEIREEVADGHLPLIKKV